MQLENNTKVYLNRLIEFTSTLSFKYNHSYGNVIAENSLVVLKDVYKITISTTCNGFDFVGFRTEIKKLIRDIEDQAEETQTEIYQIQKQLSRLLDDLFPVDTYNGTVTHEWEDHTQNDGKTSTLELCPPIEEEIRDYYMEIFDNLEGNNYLKTRIQEVVTSDPEDYYFAYINYSISKLISTLDKLQLTVPKNIGEESKSANKKIVWNSDIKSLCYLLVRLNQEKIIRLIGSKEDPNVQKVASWILNSFEFKTNYKSKQPSNDSIRVTFNKIRNTILGTDEQIEISNGEELDTITKILSKLDPFFKDLKE